MRKILYRELKKRLSRLLLADGSDIVLVSEERIKQMVEAGETPDYAIKHFGLWNRQVEFIEEEAHFPMPAVFIEFGRLAWRHQQGGLQDADLTVGLHVLTIALPEGYDGEEFHLDLLDKINRCLHGVHRRILGIIQAVGIHTVPRPRRNIERYRSLSNPFVRRFGGEETGQTSGSARCGYPNKVSCNSRPFSITAGFAAALM